jgi:hypothetical protein
MKDEELFEYCYVQRHILEVVIFGFPFKIFDKDKI